MCEAAGSRGATFQGSSLDGITSGTHLSDLLMPTVAVHPSGRPLPCSNEFSLLGELFQTPIGADSDLSALAAVRVGVTVLDRLGARGLKPHELRFIISRRTLSCRRQNGEQLSTDESDKAIRRARILVRTEVIFGNEATQACADVICDST